MGGAVACSPQQLLSLTSIAAAAAAAVQKLLLYVEQHGVYRQHVSKLLEVAVALHAHISASFT
jgi:hypothetical protein